MAAEDDEDVDSGWDGETAPSSLPPSAAPTQTESAAPKAAAPLQPPAAKGPAAKPLSDTKPVLIAPPKEAKASADAKPPAAAKPTGAAKPAVPDISMKPLARRLGEGGETAKLLADAEFDLPPKPSPKAAESIPGPTPSRKFTPKVTNAVQQAKELDTGAKQPLRRPTPMRVPMVNTGIGSAPLPPDLPPKPPTTSLRFNERGSDAFGDLGEFKSGNQRKQTLKLNRAAQDLAVEISNDEADVYSQRSRNATVEVEVNAPAQGDRISSDALDLHLDDFDDRPKSAPPKGAPAPAPAKAPKPEEKAPSTARSAGPKTPAVPPGPLAAKAGEDPLSSRLAAPRVPTTGLKSAGFRAPPRPKGLSGVTRLDTPSSLSSSAPVTTAPTQPPPPALPTPVPPGFDKESPVITIETGSDVEVSVTESDELDSLEIDEFEAASEAAAALAASPAPVPAPKLPFKPARINSPSVMEALDPEEVRGRTKPFEPYKPPKAAPPSRPEAPPSVDPETVRGGPDDDPALAPIRERFERKDYMGALMRAEALLAKDPEHTGAKYFATTCQDRVKEMYITRLGSGQSVPRLAMSPDKIQALALDHRSGFLISLIDGIATVDDVLDISGMPMIEALRLLFELKNEGVIDT